jgi:WD40 repeat protein
VTQATVAAQKTRPLPQSPYKGLVAYAAEDSEFFFGREVERELIAAHLMAARLTVLYGPSGVGKSSVLDAGVARDLTELARETVEEEDTPRRALVVFRTWHGDPAAGLAEAVAGSVRELLPDQGFDDPPPDAPLVDVLAHWADELDGRLLIVLDQFEEYFVYASNGDRFGEEFPRAVNRADLRANFVISIREDALAKLDRFKGRIPYLFDNYLRLDRLDPSAARLAIEGPLRRWAELGGARVSIEQELVENVLEEVRPDLGFGQAGTGTAGTERPDRIETTFLQLVMTKLWETERAAGSPVLRASTLKALGGAKGIVRAHLNEGLDLLTPDEKTVAAHIFQFLVTRSGQKVAHTAVDLADFSSLPLDAVTKVLERLSRRDAWILRRVDPAVGEEGIGSLYEIYHDTLGEPILAWRSTHLQRVNERKANKRARDARRRARLWAIGAAAMLAVAAACLVLLFVALHARSTADNARKAARAQELVAESEAALPTDPNDALRKAEQALEVKPSSHAEFALRTAFGASQLRVAIRHRQGAIQRAVYGDHGRRVMALGTDKTVSVSNARTGRLISRIGYDEDLLSADLSPNGRIVVTAGKDNTVRFWNASSGARLAKFRNPALSGAWLDPANPRRAVAVGDDGGLRIWRLGARTALVLRRSGPQLTRAAFSPNGRLVAAIGFSRNAWVFDARTGAHLPTLRGHGDTVVSLAWSPDSRRLITGGNDRWWRIWDVATGSANPGNEVGGPVTAVTFRPDGDAVAIATGAQASVWETTHGVPLGQLQGHGGAVTGLDFSRDGRLLLTSSTDGTARVWNLATKTTLTELRGNSGAVSSAVFSPDSRFVLTASDDSAARIWDVDTGLALWTHQGTVTDAQFALGGKVVATGGLDGEVVASDARTGAVISGQLPGPDAGAVHSIRFSRGGKLLAVATDDPALIVRYAGNGRQITRLKHNQSSVVQAVFNPKGTELAVADANGAAGIFRARTGRLVRWLHTRGQQRAHPDGRVNGIAWSPVGGFLVTVGSDAQVRVWEASSGRYVRTFWAHTGAVTSVAFAPHSDRIVTTGVDRTARVWDVSSHKAIAVLQGDPRPLYSAAFSPDGRWVVTGDSGGVVRVWDVKAEKMLAAIPAHAGPVNAVSFSPNGKRILSASDDWSAKIYPCTSCVPLQELRYRVYKREKLIAP